MEDDINCGTGEIWPADDENSVLTRELFARYGLAMYMAQVLEHGLINALMVIKKLPTAKNYNSKLDWENSVDEFYEEKFKNVLGIIIRELENDCDVPQELINAAKDARDDRNFLAHRFFQEHAKDVLTEIGKSKMIAICEKIIAKFQSVDEGFEAFTGPMKEKFGITNEVIKNEANIWIEQHQNTN